jgi:uncharacterized damage-inducible protein DinB
MLIQIRLTAFISLLFLASFAEAQESSFIEDFTQKWSNAYTYTSQVAEMMPEESYAFKPSEEEMTFGNQVKHLTSNILYMTARHLNPADSLTYKVLMAEARKAESKAEILAQLKAGFDFMDKTLKIYDPANLDKEADFFAGKMSQRRVFFLISDHLAHHRGQLVVYLRLNGLKPPRYMGW